MAMTGISAISAMVCLSSLLCILLLLFSPVPAGRGGEGRGEGGGSDAGCRGDWRSSASAWRRGVEQRLVEDFAGHPRWRAANFPLAVCLLPNKSPRRRHPSVGSGMSFSLLAGQGGEEEGWFHTAADSLGWWLRLARVGIGDLVFFCCCDDLRCCWRSEESIDPPPVCSSGGSGVLPASMVSLASFRRPHLQPPAGGPSSLPVYGEVAAGDGGNSIAGEVGVCTRTRWLLKNLSRVPCVNWKDMVVICFLSGPFRSIVSILIY